MGLPVAGSSHTRTWSHRCGIGICGDRRCIMEHGHMRRQEMHYVVKLLGQVGYFLVQVVHLKGKKKYIFLHFFFFNLNICYWGGLILGCIFSHTNAHELSHKYYRNTAGSPVFLWFSAVKCSVHNFSYWGSLRVACGGLSLLASLTGETQVKETEPLEEWTPRVIADSALILSRWLTEQELRDDFF